MVRFHDSRAPAAFGRWSRLVWGLLPALLMAMSAQAAPELQAYAGSVGGMARGDPGDVFACATGGPTIGDGWFAGLRMPTEGFAGCKLSGGIDNRLGASGTLVASQGVIATVENGSYTGQADAKASFGKLGVSASGTMTGSTSNKTYHQSSAFARFEDTWTLSAPTVASGTAGTLDLAFLLDGAIKSLPNAPYSQQGSVSLGIRINGQPSAVWYAFYGRVNDNLDPFFSGGGTWNPGDFTTSPGAFSMSGRVTSTADFSFQWGVPFDVEVALITDVEPCCFGTSLTSDFYNTAELKGILATAGNQTMTDFSVLSASGTAFGPSGLLAPAVPEPGTWLMMLAGLGILPMLRRAGQRRSSH